MTWVIAILLGLILVAMVSSNQAAAAGVWTVVRFVLWGVVSLVSWGILVGYSAWFYETYPPSGEWTQIIGVACTVVVPPILLWFCRKEIVTSYRKNKWIAVRNGVYLFAYILVLMLLGVAGREVQAEYEYAGWVMILVPLTFTGAILLGRSLAGSISWHDVWFGSPELPEPWQVVSEERIAADAFDENLLEKIREDRDELTKEQQDALRQQSGERMAATNQRLDALLVKLEAEKAERLKNGNWSVMGVFWMFAIFATFGLIGIAWDAGFAYAMELKFVKGKAWLAGGVVIFTGFVVAGLIASIWERLTESRAK